MIFNRRQLLQRAAETERGGQGDADVKECGNTITRLLLWPVDAEGQTPSYFRRRLVLMAEAHENLGSALKIKDRRLQETQRELDQARRLMQPE